MAARNWSRSPTATGTRSSPGPTCSGTRSAAGCAPVLAVGDGAWGFWGALGAVFPETAAERCWFRKIANVLGALPKSAHPGGEEGTRGDLQRREQDRGGQGREVLRRRLPRQHPKAVAKITDDLQ